MLNPATHIDPRVLGEAADWLVRLQSAGVTDADREAVNRWRDTSAQHAAAWARAEGLLNMMQQLPPRMARETMQRVDRNARSNGRRRALGMLAAVAVLPASWLAWRQKPWEQLMADLSTGTGERRAITLADGTRLLLNSDTAVDVLFSASERRIRLLKGEILIVTAPDPAPVHRAFLVQTPQGEARALGTRFLVRRLDAASRVSVFEGAVEIRNNAPQGIVVLQAGQQTSFGPEGIAARSQADEAAAMWQYGMLVAKDMRLDALLAELSRYRRGILRCDPAAAQLRVSGAFPLDDIELSLQSLTETLPLRRAGLGPFWVTLALRKD